MNWTVHYTDVLDWCEGYEGEPFHAILTDPSYGLGDNPDIEALLTAWLSGDDYDTGPGFMSKDWDVLLGPKYWRALRRVCHPGAYLFAFGGTRTADLLSMAIRLGGWERFDEIDSLSWCYGQGFPKSHAIGKAIDREAKAEREVVGTKLGQPGYSVANNGRTNKIYGDLHNPDGECTIEAPATDLAAIWEGYGTALKPAHEPILCFRNPKQGTYAQNCMSTGAGALNIDGARVGYQDESDWNGAHGGNSGSESRMPGWGMKARPQSENIRSSGRWPPNVVLSHIAPILCSHCGGTSFTQVVESNTGADLNCEVCRGSGVERPGCERRGVKRVRGTNPPRKDKSASRAMDGWGFDKGGTCQHYTAPDGTEAVDDWACVEGCPVKALGEMSGERRNGGQNVTSGQFIDGSVFNPDTSGFQRVPTSYAGDKGTAARFYPQHTWQYEIAERLADVVPFNYQAKSSRRERDAGLKGMPIVEKSGARPNSPDSTGKFPSHDHRKHGRNQHPCCKPISLVKWLATLLLPPPDYAPRRILVPFGGSGSEAIGAGLAGWDEIVMIEREEEYCTIAEARLAHWLAQIQLELSL